MTDRDHGDEPEGPDEGALGAAETGVARARKSARGRRRSLRVPVDDVPRPNAAGARDSDADGLPALAAEPTQVATVSIAGVSIDAASIDGVAIDGAPSDAAPSDGAVIRDAAIQDGASSTESPDPSVELGLAEEDLHDDDLEEDAIDEADLSSEPAPALLADADELAGSELESEPTRVAQSDLESEPTRVAASSPSVVPPSARPVTVPPPSAVGSGASARPLTVPPPARPASVPPHARPVSVAPPARPASVPPPARPASVPPPARPASVPPPARPASVPPARPASVRPPAREAVLSAAIDTDSQNGVTSPGTADAPIPEPRRSQPPTAAQRAAQPSVVVARMVRVSAPPPAMTPEPAPAAREPAALELDDEPEVSVGEIDAFEEFEIDDDRDPVETRSRDSAPDLTDEALEDSDGTSSAEIELPEEDAEDADEPITPALRPPPPPRETARTEAKAPHDEAKAPPHGEQPEPEEELHDLEVDDPSGELDGASREERQAQAEAQLRSAPPPPPDKAPKAAPASAPAEPAAEPARRTKKKPNWWEDFFNDDYLRTVPPPHPRQIARQCDFIETRFGLKAGGTILDVGCGLGLHAIELTRRGYLVVGLDLSLPMLSRAADEAQDHGLRINFLHADMKEMSFEGAFDAVMCVGTTYGYFDDDANRALVERLYRALKPKGKLLLEVVNRDFVVRSQPNLVWFEGDGCVVMEETKANYINSRLEVKRTVILDDGRQRDNAYSVRLYSLHELGLVLHQRGFRVLEVSGREATPGVFFGADSPKLIILAERRVQQAPPPPKKSGGTPGEGPATGELMVELGEAPLPAPSTESTSGNGSSES